MAKQYADAFADGDTRKACELMSTEAKTDLAAGGVFLGAKGCEGVLKAALGFLDKADREKLRDFKVTSVKITGDKALAQDNVDLDAGGSNEPTYLVKKGGGWLIDKDPTPDDESSGQSTTETGPSTDTTEVAPAQTTVKVGERLRQSDYVITVTAARTASELPADEYSEPVQAKGKLVILSLRVRNNKNELASFDDSMVKLVDEDGTIYSSGTGASENQIGSLPNYIDERDIQPKTSESGDLAFDIPKSAKIEKAQFAASLGSFSEDFTGAVALALALR